MIDAARFKQLLLFSLLTVLSYGVYERFFNLSTNDKYKAFTKGYALTGVVIKSTDETGAVVTTVQSPAITHYADSEVTVIEQPNITLHEAQGNWVFTSESGQINPDKTEIYFPEQVVVNLDSESENPITITTSALEVNVIDKIGKTKAELKLDEVGTMLKGLGAVINFNQQEIEILSEMYAEFEN